MIVMSVGWGSKRVSGTHTAIFSISQLFSLRHLVRDVLGVRMLYMVFCKQR